MPININLQWDKDNNNIKAYEIQRRIGLGEWITIAVIPQILSEDKITYQDLDVNTSRPYPPTLVYGEIDVDNFIYLNWNNGFDNISPIFYYRVCSIHVSGNKSNWSEVLSIRPSNGIQKYKYKIVNALNDVLISEGETNLNNIVISDLPLDMKYKVAVQSINYAGRHSKWSQYSSEFSKPNASLNLSVDESFS